MNIFWQDVVGHTQVVKRLREMHNRKRLPHALLFCGDAGIGKKTVARVLAAVLLCNRPISGVPCGECESCRRLMNDVHPDLIEISPEGKTLKSIRIEKIRELRQFVSRYPVMAGSRVAIIDDAHLMNEAAGNALLKSIEEPVGNVYFILVTDKPGSLLGTIISRCTTVNFCPLVPEEIIEVLRRLNFSAVDAERLCVVADGSVARAMEFGTNDGIALYSDAVKFLLDLDNMPLEAVLAKGEMMAKMPKERLRDWLLHINSLLRDLLVLSVGGVSNARGNERDMLIKVLPRFTKARLFAMQKIVGDMLGRMSANVNLRLFAESCLIRLSQC